MNTIPANELKRRGVIALEEKVKYGAVHIIKNNIPICVVLSEQEYQQLTMQQKPVRLSLSELIKKTAAGEKTPQEIDNELKKMRDEWD